MSPPPSRTLADAVASHVDDGAMIYVGNFGAQLFAIGHELIRQGRRDLHAVMSSGGILLDQLLGSGTLAAATFAHCWSPVGPAPAWNFRRLGESGTAQVELREVSLGILNCALTAAAWGLPFQPTPDLRGTGYVDEDWGKGMLATVSSPFGDALVARALRPDVAFVHVDAVTRSGSGMLRGPHAEMSLAARAAETVVLVAEEVVDDDDARQAPLAVAVPSLLVDTVVVCPGALHPDGAVGRYDRDLDFYERYEAAAADPQGFRSWLAHWVLGVDDHAGYRALVQAAQE